jgi:ATP-dependent helicase YprA (DUF1998 family)
MRQARDLSSPPGEIADDSRPCTPSAEAGGIRSVSVGFSELFRRATRFDPYPYQVALAEAPALPLLVRAPTGSGKTAAAFLAWLYRRRFHEDPQVRATRGRCAHGE